MGLKLGVVLPVVQLTQRFKPPEWEVRAGPKEIARMARVADDAGYDFIASPEHVAIPSDIASWRGGRYFDPAVTLGFVAAHTERAKLLTHTVVLGYHHPLALVKRYATLDVMSGGRLILGVGVGSLEPEFKLLGQDFANRGRKADDAMRAIRAGFSSPAPEYRGEFYSFSGFLLDPNAVQAHVPMWVGGRTRLSLRRALTLGDGWIPFGLDADALGAMIADAKAGPLWEKRPAGFELALAPEKHFAPLTDAAGCRALIEQYLAIGATAISVRFLHESLDHYCDQLEALSDIVAAYRNS